MTNSMRGPMRLGAPTPVEGPPPSAFEDCTVASVDPLLVSRDGDSTLTLEADSLIAPASLAVNDRVRVENADGRLIVHGRADGAGTSAPTPDAVVRRDAAGRFQAVDALADADVVTLAQLVAHEIDAAKIVSGALDAARRWAGAPLAVATGEFAAGPSSSTSFVTSVSFPVGRFSTKPRVAINLASGAGETTQWSGRAISITTSGFTLFGFTPTGVAATFSQTWQWIAVED